MIAHMLGVPAEDLPTFRTWSDAIAIAATDPTDPRAMVAIDFFVYFNAKLDARAERIRIRPTTCSPRSPLTPS